MQKLHKFFEKKSSVYANWHIHPNRSFHHFAVFLFAAVVLCAATVITIKQDVTLVLNSIEASANKKPDQNIQKLSTSLLQALKAYEKAAEKDRDTALNELKSVVSTRRQALIQATITNPEEVVLATLPTALYNRLPAEAQMLAEQQVDVTGVLTVLHIDYLEESRNGFEYTLNVKEEDGEKIYKVKFAKGELKALTGDRIRVKGTKIDDSLTVAEAGGGSTTVVSTAVAGLAGDQKTLAILVNFADNPSQPFTTTDVTNSLFNSTGSSNAFYKEGSFNTTSLSGTAVGWVTLPPMSNCDYYGIASAAESEASKTGVNVSNYPRRVFVLHGGGCGWAGLGTLGGNPSRAWINGHLNPFVYTHELGHNLGMHHAASYTCGGKQIDVSGNCSMGEYGDPFDSMGGSWVDRHNNGAHKNQVGWVNVKSVTTSGTYTINPLETGTGTHVLKIPKADTGENYYVEYRQRIGFDSGLPDSAVNGVSVIAHNGSSQTKRLDLTPDGDFGNTSLADGGVFSDPSNGLTVTQLSHDASGATVQVSMSGAPCTKNNPTLSINPLSQTGKQGQTLSYNLNVKNNDSSTCESTSFSLSATVLSDWVTTLSTSSVNLAPGQNTNLTFTLTSALTTTDGSYYGTISATDLTDSSHTASALATYMAYTPAPDTTNPTVVITSPSSGGILPMNTNFAATASDNVKVTKVEFYMDGAILSSDTSAPFSYKWNTKKVIKGSHSLTAKAFDAAGNSATSSITVNK